MAFWKSSMLSMGYGHETFWLQLKDLWSHLQKYCSSLF
jgi:hypothetical protein